MVLQTDEDLQHEQTTLREYLKRRSIVEGELQILKDDLKMLDDEFRDKLDMKTLKLAMSVAKAQAKVAHKFTFDNFLETLESEGV